jgi:hypothetical protein
MAKMTVRARATFLPEERFLPLRPALQAHLAKFGDAISSENFLSVCCEMVLEILKGTLEQISADEGSVWLLDQEKQHLVVAYNSGPNAEKIIARLEVFSTITQCSAARATAAERSFSRSELNNALRVDGIFHGSLKSARPLPVGVRVTMRSPLAFSVLTCG